MDNIRRSLVGLAKNKDEDNVTANFAEELNRFRNWYSVDSKVVCSSVLTGQERIENLRDALILSRLEKLDGDKFYYDFDACRDYKLDDYIMSFADVIAAAQQEENQQ